MQKEIWAARKNVSCSMLSPHVRIGNKTKKERKTFVQDINIENAKCIHMGQKRVTK